MEHKTIQIDDIVFCFVSKIELCRDTDGNIQEFMPQSRYKNSKTTKLNPNGAGPFCRFKIPNAPSESGVYLVTVRISRVYVGECQNLAVRWGLGQYGSISPVNCYVRGQSTNCKINHRILEAYKSGLNVKLWFHETDKHKQIEAYLRAKLNPPWNN